MRAVQFDHYGGPEVLRLDEVPIPEPAPGQVLVRVEATAVHPGDLIARAGGFAAVIASRDVYRLGWDFYGRVHSTGPDVDDVSLGMPVVGMTDWLRDLNGTHADFVAVPRTAVVAAPANLDPDAAAALPVNALTAAQALDLLPLMAGDTLVIVGAAGAVGGFALELAVDRGLRVLGVASPADEAFIGARGGVFLDRGLDLATQVYTRSPAARTRCSIPRPSRHLPLPPSVTAERTAASSTPTPRPQRVTSRSPPSASTATPTRWPTSSSWPTSASSVLA